METPTPEVFTGADLHVCLCEEVEAHWYTVVLVSQTEFTNQITQQSFVVKRMVPRLVARAAILTKRLQSRDVCTLVEILKCCLTANDNNISITVRPHTHVTVGNC